MRAVNVVALLAAGAAAVPIPQGPGSLPDFIGHSAQPQPIVAVHDGAAPGAPGRRPRRAAGPPRRAPGAPWV
jgi:hypothetical protein